MIFRWLLGLDGGVGASDAADDFGPVCPCCGRYDWPTMAVATVTCRTGVHRVKRCEGCDHFDARYDCEGH